MENNMKNFDDLFRDELADHAEVPPSRVWESLEKRLNANAAGGKSTFSKGWYWYVGVASVAMLMGTIGWNLASKNADRTAPAVAQVSETVAPAVEEPATMPEAAAQNNARQIAAVHHRLAPHSYERVSEERTDDVSPYGNAAATGTKLHSYDEFDERAVATTQKLAPLNSDEEHAAHGYKVNLIKKNRMVVAEMVPIHQQEPVAAAAGANAAETTKPVATNRPRVRTIAGKLASAQAPKKTVILVNNAGNGEATPANDPGNDVAAPVTAAAPDVNPADKPVSTSMPVPAGTATAAKSKPASEVIIPAKPTTGGSDPVKGASAAQSDNAEDGTEEKKGLFGIFKKKKK